MLAEQSRTAFEIICTAWSNNSVEAMSDTDLEAVRTAMEKAGVRFEGGDLVRPQDPRPGEEAHTARGLRGEPRAAPWDHVDEERR